MRGTGRHSPALLGVPLVIFSTCSLVGTAVAPRLLPSHPLWVIALAPRTAFLLSAAPRVSCISYLVVAAARLAAADPFSYLLGRHHCPAKLRRALPERIVASGHRLVVPAVALSPSGKVLVVAGALGAPSKSVVIADAIGTVVQVLTVRWVGGVVGPLSTGGALAAAAVTAIAGCLAVHVARVVRRRCDMGQTVVLTTGRHARSPRDTTEEVNAAEIE